MNSVVHFESFHVCDAIFFTLSRHDMSVQDRPKLLTDGNEFLVHVFGVSIFPAGSYR